MDIDKIISIIHKLREEVANPPGTSGGFSGSADSKGPTAGFDPVMNKMQRRNKPIFLGRGSRKNWLPKKSK